MKIELIWKEYQSGLYSFLHSRIANTADVDDLLQEVLIKTHKSLHSVSDPGKLKSWIFQIANNTIIDYYRKNSKRNDLIADDLWYQKGEEGLIIEELSSCLLPFIKQLSQEDADLLIAIEIKGVSQKEYAKKNDVNYSTLKSRVKKSRKKLENLFHNCCDFSLDMRGNMIEYHPKSGSCNRC
jgi:RNA polymerase sigma-70 factor (ECF subfamily)